MKQIHSDREELKRELLLIKDREPNLSKPTLLSEQDKIRNALIVKLETAITSLTEKGFTNGQDLTLSKQALLFLKQNRVSRVDSTRHLNTLLDANAFSAQEIGENAKLLLKFVRMSERMTMEGEKMRHRRQLPSYMQGLKTTMSVKGYGTTNSTFI